MDQSIAGEIMVYGANLSAAPVLGTNRPEPWFWSYCESLRQKIHSSSQRDANSFDIIDENTYKKLNGGGKLLTDTDLCDPNQNLNVLVYASNEAKQLAQKEYQILGAFEYPQELLEQIEVIKSRRFGVDVRPEMRYKIT